MISISKQFSSTMAATILFFCLPGFPYVVSHADCIPHERAALLQLHFRRLGIEPVYPPASLNPLKGLNCCAWEGIECSQSTGNIIKLDLSHQWLFGNIGSSLAELRFLQYLDLSWNFLTGVIPPQIDTLFRLQHLDLGSQIYNLESGSIPWVGNLSKLSYLSLNFVDLSGWAFSTWSLIPPLQHLSMSYCSLAGVIPSSLYNLTSLAYLDLSYNRIEGVIPGSIANLYNLAELNLNYNTLSGSISHSFSNLSSLRSLSLRHNQLNGSVPSFLAFHPALAKIGLSGNSLTGNISLSLLQHLPRLTWLGLSHNHLAVNTTLLSIPAFQLQFLGLAACNIVDEFPSFLSTQYDLQFLDLSDNRLVGNIPSWLWDLEELSYLNLSYNVFQGRLPLALNPPSLQSLDLKNNSLEGPLPLPPPAMRVFDLSENQFSGFIAPEIGKYTPQLEFWSLSKNKLSGTIPFDICQGNIQMLGVLDLSGNRFSSIASPGLQNCSKLSVLNLGNNNLEYKDIVERLGTLPSLSTLFLNNNRLSGYSPMSVRKYTNLKMINLNENSIRGSIPEWIGSLKELRVLLAKSNKLSGHIPWTITSLDKLQIVDLSFNNLQGEIPNNLTGLHAMIHPLTDIHSLESLYFSLNTDNYDHPFKYIFNNQQKYEDEADLTNKGQRLHYVEEILSIVASIDLSNNNLSGEIPAELGVLEGSRILNVSTNVIRGQIPETLKNLSELESFDVSHNKLNGIIPSQLQSITSLEIFDVSYNNLSGRIPDRNQFTTFEAWMFEGNKYLCGIQVNRTCGDGTDYWSPPPKKGKEEAERGKRLEIPWWNVSVGLSFGVAFSCVFFVLAVNRRCRSEYFRVIDGIVIGLLEWFGVL